MDESSIQRYFVKRENLNKLFIHEELYWKQHAIPFWLTEADRNSKFFHACALARKKSNYINQLRTSDNEINIVLIHKKYNVDL